MYNITFNGNQLELPQYTVATAKKIEKLETLDGDIEFKLKSLYGFLSELFGKGKVEELLGTFNKADPSLINILYLKTVREYNRPVEEYQEELSFGLLDDPRIENAINKLDSMYRIKDKKND